jgi:hypothetical protein
MTTTTTMQIGPVSVEVQPDPDHGWTVTTAEAARGFACDADAILRQWRIRVDLVRGTHWLAGDGEVVWTRRGIMRLGFLLVAPRARPFVVAAEKSIRGDDAKEVSGAIAALSACSRDLAARVQASIVLECRAAGADPANRDRRIFVASPAIVRAVFRVSKCPGCHPTRLVRDLASAGALPLLAISPRVSIYPHRGPNRRRGIMLNDATGSQNVVAVVV